MVGCSVFVNTLMVIYNIDFCLTLLIMISISRMLFLSFCILIFSYY